MRTIQVKISESDFQKFNFHSEKEIDFAEIVDKVNSEFEKQTAVKIPVFKSKRVSSIDLIFGLWNDSGNSLNEIREKQWLRKKR